MDMDTKMEHGEHGGGGMDHGMSMSFHFSTSVTILFDFWTTTNVGGLLGSIVLVFFMGVAYEGLKFLREFLILQHKKKSAYQVFPPQGQHGGLRAPPQTGVTVQPKISMLSSTHAIQTGLHFVQFVLSYFLMLIFMTYNVWICMGVAFGVTVGYFFFGWQRESLHDSNEHCH